MSVSLQSAIPWQPIETAVTVEDAGEHLLLSAGVITKSMSKVYAYLPLGMRLRRKLLRRFEAVVEARGFEPVQLTALQQDNGVPGPYDGFLCRVSSHYFGQRCLLSDTKDAVGQLIRRSLAGTKQHAVWTLSREWRASGGSGGFHRSIEYENLIAYRTGVVGEDLPGEGRELLDEATKGLRLACSWEAPGLSAAAEYEAHNLTANFGAGEAFRIGQVCAFTRASAVKAGLAEAVTDGCDGRGGAVCFSLSMNRTIYALARVLAAEERGTWPISITPYHAHVVLIGRRPELRVQERLDALISELSQHGLDLLLDDRPISAGRKLFDSDLLRIPFRLVVGGSDCVGLRMPNREEIKVAPELATRAILERIDELRR